jgi:hypothetical protein
MAALEAGSGPGSSGSGGGGGGGRSAEAQCAKARSARLPASAKGTVLPSAWPAAQPSARAALPSAPGGRPGSADVVRRSAVFREVRQAGAFSPTLPSELLEPAELLEPSVAAAAEPAGGGEQAPGAPPDGALLPGSALLALLACGAACALSDDAVVELLRQPPKQVPPLRTRYATQGARELFASARRGCGRLRHKTHIYIYMRHHAPQFGLFLEKDLVPRVHFYAFLLLAPRPLFVLSPPSPVDRDSFRRFFAGVGERRMGRLLARAYAGSAEDGARRAQKRLALVQDLLTKD